MELATMLKLACMATFFLEVVIFGRLIANLPCLQRGNLLSFALSFSGGLFLSIAILHIIPDASHDFNQALAISPSSIKSLDELNSEWFLPYSQIIAAATYLLVMIIDKLMMDAEKQAVHAAVEDKNFVGLSEEVGIGEKKSEENQKVEESAWRPILLQVGMGIHAFFQCLAVGLQQTKSGVILLATAIVFHKWAQGLSLGLMYTKNGYSRSTTNLAVFTQGLINICGLVVGCLLAQSGPLITATFMSISAGTFLYISTGQVLPQQLSKPSKLNILAVFLANIFMASVFLMQSINSSE